MSQMLPRRTVITFDPLTEHLKNLQPDEVNALQMMQGVYSNQIALTTAVISLQHQAINSDDDLHGLADSVAANTLPRLTPICNEIKEHLNNG
ncbi:hypothetical protein [Moritella sp.]|uniref:hypothetical protein n=1 Tax=Moritella sp. TaxID=78556 RepID=UPI001DE08487|nr:hypothetical protein [Moritella sp.]MCJ8350729.1 hypothetical protein [Moritella sp.]NQZ41069.1 hypothetical protein [Moritella sp.]